MPGREDGRSGTEGPGLIARYLGFAFQLLISLGIALFLGGLADRKLNIPFPLLVWLLPLVVLVAMLVKLIRETSEK